MVGLLFVIRRNTVLVNRGTTHHGNFFLSFGLHSVVQMHGGIKYSYNNNNNKNNIIIINNNKTAFNSTASLFLL